MDAEGWSFVTKGQQQKFVRFVLPQPHPDTGVEEGIFSAAYHLRDGARRPIQEREALESLLSWFKTNLAIPERFNRSKSKGFYRRKTAGVSWLKPSALEHIDKMRALVVILEKNGYRVSKITTNRPGYVVFEDDNQVVAEPFRGQR
jgi:hypothetical protein